MKHFHLLIVAVSTALMVIPRLNAQPRTGGIEGKIVDESTKDGIPGANVLVDGTMGGTSSDLTGQFEIKGLEPGNYDLVVSLVGYQTRRVSGVSVREGESTTVRIELVETSVQLGEVTVFGASRRQERITDAPTAVSVLDASDVKRKSVSGQVPKLLEAETGVDIVQSGLYDFNINTRGFNSSLNRRLLVLLDGRDLAIAFLSSQEWNGLSIPVEDIWRMELVRGPASALYGANAFNGVINIQTPDPSSIRGTKLSLAGGEWSSFRMDARHAGVSGPWGYKINLGRFQGESWHLSRRNLRFEYDGFSLLNNEEVDLPTNRVASTYGSGRVDYAINDAETATAEAGLTQAEGEVFVTGIGRILVPKALKPWGRISYSSPAFYVQFWGAGRDSKEPQLSLSSGLPLIERSTIGNGEVQYRTPLVGNTLFFIGGASFRYQRVETERTLMLEDRTDNSSGVYAQLEFDAVDNLRVVLASRWDRSTIHEDEVSPKVALVWSPARDHTLRATFNKAFQSPNLSELFLFVLRTATSPYNPNLKSHSAFLGNSDLTIEKITGYELGYKGILSSDLYVTVDGYLNSIRDFITDLTPGVHPDYPEPSVLPDDPQGFTRTIWSYANAGKVREGGAEVSVRYYLGESWVLDGNYSYFDFKVLEKGVSESDLTPNAPRHKGSGAVTFRGSDYEVGVTVKHVPSFDWAAGIYKGRIQAYTLVDVSGHYRLNGLIEFGLAVTNLLDKTHYQIFGGSFIHRRVLLSATATF
jgi:iron complex outermembrane receptor protein